MRRPTARARRAPRVAARAALLAAAVAALAAAGAPPAHAGDPESEAAALERAIEEARREEVAEAARIARERAEREQAAAERAAALAPEQAEPGATADPAAAFDPGRAERESRAWQAEQMRAQAEAESARAKNEAWRAAWRELAAHREFREAGCFASASQLAALDGDRIRHRRLTRDDFRARRRSRDAKLAVAMKNAVTEAHVATSLVCIGRLRAEEVTRGRFAVWFDDLEYVALLDREGSWWNPKLRTHPEWVLRHEQLHFDITELMARRRNRERESDVARTRVVAGSPGEAMRAFAERWSAHFAAVLAEWEALEQQYDRETRHGTVPAVQTEWFARVHRELATLPAPAARASR